MKVCQFKTVSVMCIKGASIYIERMLSGGRLSHFTVVEKKIIICMKKEISLHRQYIHLFPILLLHWNVKFLICIFIHSTSHSFIHLGLLYPKKLNTNKNQVKNALLPSSDLLFELWMFMINQKLFTMEHYALKETTSMYLKTRRIFVAILGKISNGFALCSSK